MQRQPGPVLSSEEWGCLTDFGLQTLEQLCYDWPSFEWQMLGVIKRNGARSALWTAPWFQCNFWKIFALAMTQRSWDVPGKQWPASSKEILEISRRSPLSWHHARQRQLRLFASVGQDLNTAFLEPVKICIMRMIYIFRQRMCAIWRLLKSFFARPAKTCAFLYLC